MGAGADQKDRYPTDTGFDYATTLATLQFTWGRVSVAPAVVAAGNGGNDVPDPNAN
jgi:hypothetical protein